MELENIIEIGKYLLMLCLGGFTLYFKYNARLKDNVVNAINKAEEMYKDQFKAGGLKMELAIDLVYNIIPTALKPIFTKEIIRNIIQSTFDEMEDYAVKQLDKLTKNEKENV